jgi:hypothetical protein
VNHRIDIAIISVFHSSVLGHGLKLRPGQSKDYNISMSDGLLFNAKWSMCQLCRGECNVFLDEMVMVVYVFIVRSNVAPLGHNPDSDPASLLLLMLRT